jgi:hypothetical protein
MLECLMGVCGGPRVEAGVDASADVTPEAATDVASVVDGPAAPDVAPIDVAVVVDTPPTQDVVATTDADVMIDVAPDAGTTAQQDDGCGCRAHGRSRNAPWLLWAALIAVMRTRRSRRVQPSAR